MQSDMKFSFSRLESFCQCPLSFKLKYLDHVPQDGNFYSDYGTFAHGLLERYAKEEIPSFALAQVYEEGFDEAVTHDPPPFPKGLLDRYYDAGLAYFNTFDGFGEEWKVALIDGKPAVEQKFEIQIGGYPFVGILDLLLVNEKTGEYMVVDHKSKSKSSMDKSLPVFKRQLYIYAAYVKEKLGVTPSTLCFNMFKEGYLLKIPFSQEEFDEAMTWVVDTIEQILLEFEFEPTPSEYFCRFICSVAQSCPLYGEPDE